MDISRYETRQCRRTLRDRRTQLALSHWQFKAWLHTISLSVERSNECGAGDNDVQRRSSTAQQFAQDSPCQVPIRTAHTEFPVTSTFLQCNIRHLITRNISPAHTADVVSQPYTRLLAFYPKNVATEGGWGGNLTSDSKKSLFRILTHWSCILPSRILYCIVHPCIYSFSVVK